MVKTRRRRRARNAWRTWLSMMNDCNNCQVPCVSESWWSGSSLMLLCHCESPSACSRVFWLRCQRLR